MNKFRIIKRHEDNVDKYIVQKNFYIGCTDGKTEHTIECWKTHQEYDSLTKAQQFKHFLLHNCSYNEEVVG